MDDITNAELARRLDSMRRDMHDDLTAINRRLDSYVLREVYQSDQRGQEARMQAIERELTEVRVTAKAAEDQRVTDQRVTAEKRSTERRWVLAAIVMPVLALVVQVVLSVRGPA